jgi:hypothetical protein
MSEHASTDPEAPAQGTGAAPAPASGAGRYGRRALLLGAAAAGTGVAVSLAGGAVASAQSAQSAQSAHGGFGVHGDCDVAGGVGVFATSSKGIGLAVTGNAWFSASGVQEIPSGSSSI